MRPITARAALMVFMVVLTAVLTGSAFTACGENASSSLPHLILVTLDTTRADHLGCYGYGRDTSPNLDILAADAVRFDLAIAQAAVTPVSHASILTGLNPYNHGLRVMHGLHQNRLAEEQRTLAEMWKESGGRTAAFISAYPASAAFGLDQGFEHFDDEFPPSEELVLDPETGIVNTQESQRRADETNEAVFKYLEEGFDSKSPLFLWVHYFDPHDPYRIPPGDISQHFPPVTSERADVLRALYDSEIFFMDREVGRLFEVLRGAGLWEDAIVVVVSDHGEGLGDHQWWSHGILYQEQIRVPLIMRFPAVEGGRTVPSLVRTIDIVPTIIDAAGLSPRFLTGMDGESLMEEVRGSGKSPKRTAYADSVNLMAYDRLDIEGGSDKKSDRLYSLMNEEHKLIYHQLRPEETEFFDLRVDGKELNNLASRRPPPMARFQAMLEEENVFSEDLPLVSPTDRERLEKLKSLGYTQ